MAQDEPTLEIALFLLTIVGCNPRKQNNLAKVLRFLTKTSSYLMVTAYASEMILNYRGVETIIKIYLLPHFITFLGTLHLDIEKLGEIVEHLDRFWSIDRHGPKLKMKLSKYHKYTTILIKQFAANIYAVSFIPIYYCLAKPVPRELPTSCCSVCDFQSDLCYFSLFLYEMVMMFCQCYPFIVGFDAIFICVIVYTYNALEVLRAEIHLLQVTSDTSRDRFNKILRGIIEQHNVILSFIDKLNRFFNLILMFLYCTALGTMTFSLYMITYITPPVPMQLLEFGGIYGLIAFRMGAFCLGGSIISAKVTSIGDEIFQLPWWISAKHRKDLSFIVMRSQRNDAVSVGGIMMLGLPSFIELLRTTTSVYTMLKTMEK